MGFFDLFKKNGRARKFLSRLPEFEIKDEVLIKYNGNAEAVVIPETVSVIGEDAFSGCKALRTVDFHDGILSIADRAFDGCINLESIRGCKSLMVIGASAFRKCESLLLFDFPPCCMDVFQGAFEGCKNLTEIVLPDGISAVNHALFRDCVKLKKVYIPKGVQIIETHAFDNCKALSSINLPDSISEFGLGAFQGCASITEIVIPDGVERLQKNLFQWCRSLKSVVIPDSVIEFGESVFSGCESLDNIFISDRVQKISDKMFFGCKSLRNITISDSVKTIGESAFEDCLSLKELDLPESVVRIDNRAFLHCACQKNIEALRSVKHKDPDDIADWEYSFDEWQATIIEYKGTGREITVPKYICNKLVTIIEEGAFAKHSIISIELPDSIDTIKHSAFMECTSLKKIVFPHRMTRINSNICIGCTALEEIVLPERLVMIGSNAFARCQSLKSVFIPKRVATIDSSAFFNSISLHEFKVDEENPYFSEIDGVLCTKDKKELVTLPSGYPTAEYHIPPCVTQVAIEAIGYCKHLKRLVFHENVRYVGARMLHTCPVLEEAVVLGSKTAFYSFARLSPSCALIVPKRGFDKLWSGETEKNAIYGYTKVYYCGGYEYEESVVREIEEYIVQRRDRLIYEFEKKPYIMRYMIEKKHVHQEDFDRLFSFYHNNIGVIADLLDYRRRNFPDETDGGIGDNYSLD